MAIKNGSKESQKVRSVCSTGTALTIEEVEALVKTAESGGMVSLNGASLTGEDLLLLAEQVRDGAVFCLLRPKIDDKESIIVDGETAV